MGKQKKTEDTRNLLETHEVINSTNQLYTTLLDAETGQRNLLPTCYRSTYFLPLKLTKVTLKTMLLYACNQ